MTNAWCCFVSLVILLLISCNFVWAAVIELHPVKHSTKSAPIQTISARPINHNLYPVFPKAASSKNSTSGVDMPGGKMTRLTNLRRRAHEICRFNYLCVGEAYETWLIPRIEDILSVETLNIDKPLNILFYGHSMLRQLFESIVLYYSFEHDPNGTHPESVLSARRMSDDCILGYETDCSFRYTDWEKPPNNIDLTGFDNVGMYELLRGRIKLFSIMNCYIFQHYENGLQATTEFMRVNEISHIIYMEPHANSFWNVQCCQAQLCRCDRNIPLSADKALDYFSQHMTTIPLKSFLEVYNTWVDDPNDDVLTTQLGPTPGGYNYTKYNPRYEVKRAGTCTWPYCTQNIFHYCMPGPLYGSTTWLTKWINAL